MPLPVCVGMVGSRQVRARIHEHSARRDGPYGEREWDFAATRVLFHSLTAWCRRAVATLETLCIEMFGPDCLTTPTLRRIPAETRATFAWGCVAAKLRLQPGPGILPLSPPRLVGGKQSDPDPSSSGADVSAPLHPPAPPTLIASQDTTIEGTISGRSTPQSIDNPFMLGNGAAPIAANATAISAPAIFARPPIATAAQHHQPFGPLVTLDAPSLTASSPPPRTISPDCLGCRTLIARNQYLQDGGGRCHFHSYLASIRGRSPYALARVRDSLNATRRLYELHTLITQVPPTVTGELDRIRAVLGAHACATVDAGSGGEGAAWCGRIALALAMGLPARSARDLNRLVFHAARRMPPAFWAYHLPNRDQWLSHCGEDFSLSGWTDSLWLEFAAWLFNHRIIVLTALPIPQPPTFGPPDADTPTAPLVLANGHYYFISSASAYDPTSGQLAGIPPTEFKMPLYSEDRGRISAPRALGNTAGSRRGSTTSRSRMSSRAQSPTRSPRGRNTARKTARGRTPGRSRPRSSSPRRNAQPARRRGGR